MDNPENHKLTITETKGKSKRSLNITITIPIHEDKHPNTLSRLKTKVLGISNKKAKRNYSRKEKVNKVYKDTSSQNIYQWHKTKITHDDDNDLQRQNEVESYLSFINNLKVSTNDIFNNSKICSESISDLYSSNSALCENDTRHNIYKKLNTQNSNVINGNMALKEKEETNKVLSVASVSENKVKSKKSKFCKGKRNSLNTSFLHNFSELKIYQNGNATFTGQESGKDQLKTEEFCSQKINHHKYEGNKDLNFMNFGYQKKKTEYCLGKLDKQSKSLDDSKEVLFNKGGAQSKKKGSESKIGNLCYSRCNTEENKINKKTINNVTCATELSGIEKGDTSKTENQDKHLKLPKTIQHREASESSNIALKRCEVDKNNIIDKNSKLDKSTSSRNIYTIPSEQDKNAFLKYTEQQKLISEYVNGITASMPSSNITDISGIDEKILRQEISKTGRQENNILLHNTEEGHKISSNETFCKEGGGLRKRIHNQDTVQILGTNMQTSKEKKIFNIKERVFSKKKKENMLTYDIRKFIKIPQEKEVEKILKDVIVKSEQNIKDSGPRKSQPFLNEETFINNLHEKVSAGCGSMAPLQKEDITTQTSKDIYFKLRRNSEDKTFDNSIKNTIHSSKEDTPHKGLPEHHKNNEAREKSKRQAVKAENNINEKLAATGIEKNEIQNDNLVQRPLSYTKHDSSYNKKRQLKDLYNQASKHCKRLRMENELLDSELIDINSMKKNMANKTKEKNLKHSHAQCGPSVTNTNNLVVVKETQKNIGNSNIVLNNEVASTSTRLRAQEAMQNGKCTSNGLLQTVESNKLPLESSTVPKYAEEINDPLDSERNNFSKKVSDKNVSNSSRKTTSKQRRYKKVKTHLQYEDSSDDEEKDLSGIMNYLKDYAYDRANSNASYESKLTASVQNNSRKNTSSRKNAVGIYSSDESNSDSSISVYAAQLKNNQCIESKHVSRRQNKKTSNLKIKTNTLLNFLNQSKNTKKESISEHVKSDNTNLSLIKDEEKKLSLKDKLSNLDSSGNYSKDPVVKASGTHTKKNCQNIDNNGINNKSSQQSDLQNISDVSRQPTTVDTGNLLHSEYSPTKSLGHMSTDDSKKNIDIPRHEDDCNSDARKEIMVENEKKQFESDNTTFEKYSTISQKRNIKKWNLRETIKRDNYDTQKQTKEMILEYVNEAMSERYTTASKSVKKQGEPTSDDDNFNDIKGSISNFETEKESDDECNTKILEIISCADNEILNTLEANEQLRDLKINISWDVPISHRIETRISSCPNKEQLQVFKDLNIKWKIGPFTVVEDETIKANFTKFCMEHGLEHDPTPFLHLRYGQVSVLSCKERIKFGRYLGRGLENRKLYCIYSRFKILYSTFKKGRFTPEEDAVIMRFVKIVDDNQKRFSALSKVLNRPRSLIEKRFRIILRRQAGLLKPCDYPRLVKCLIEVTNSDNLKELRHKRISNEKWCKVAEKLHLCKNHLKVCWIASLYTKLFHEGPIDVDKIIRKLVAILDRRKVVDYKELNWTELAKSFRYMTNAFLYRLFKKTTIRVVPQHLHSNLRECVLYLKKIYEKDKDVMQPIDNIILEI